MNSRFTQILLSVVCSASPLLAQQGNNATNYPHTVSGQVSSGGVACFDKATQESSSATLAENYVVLGGGEGNCPKTVSGLYADLNGDLTANSLLTDLINSNGASDTVVENGGIERLRLPNGHPTISLTVNKPANYLYPNEPGNGTSPSPATVQIFSAPTDDGKSGPFDQLSLTNPLGTNRRAAIMFQSYCDPGTVTSCVPRAQVDEWEMGIDIAPNGTRNFFIYDEQGMTTDFWAGPYQTISLGTTDYVGGAGNPNGSGIQGDVTVRRLNAAGASPQCSVNAGWGAGASCQFQGGSTDTAGLLLITTGLSPGSSGAFNIVWSEGSNFGQNITPVCVANLVNYGANYNPRATAILNNQNLQTNQWIVDNNGVNFATSTTYAYGVTYICVGK